MELQQILQVRTHYVVRRSTLGLIVFLIFLASFPAVSQPVTGSLKKIALQDKVLERVLRDYVNESKAKIIAVYIERYDSDYTYTLRDFGLFDTVKRNPTATFGEWKGCVLLFYSGAELVVSPLDSNAVGTIQRYLRPMLPDQFGEKKTYSNGMLEDTAIVFDPIIWRFKVREGKLLWLRKVQDYQLETIPYIK